MQRQFFKFVTRVGWRSAEAPESVALNYAFDAVTPAPAELGPILAFDSRAAARLWLIEARQDPSKLLLLAGEGEQTVLPPVGLALPFEPGPAYDFWRAFREGAVRAVPGTVAWPEGTVGLAWFRPTKIA